jgi:hypothetical protein
MNVHIICIKCVSKIASICIQFAEGYLLSAEEHHMIHVPIETPKASGHKQKGALAWHRNDLIKLIQSAIRIHCRLYRHTLGIFGIYI